MRVWRRVIQDARKLRRGAPGDCQWLVVRSGPWQAQPTEPYVSSHLFPFKPAGDGWRLAKDLTKSELYDG